MSTPGAEAIEELAEALYEHIDGKSTFGDIARAVLLPETRPALMKALALMPDPGVPCPDCGGTGRLPGDSS